MPQPPDRTDRLAALDHAHVWHPFTPMALWRQREPVIIDRGEGEYLIDTRGNRYIDGVSSLWCNVHGHHVPEIDRAIREQLDRLAHTTMLGLASPPSIELAARLVKLAGGVLNKVFYSDAGATALEVAFKMAVGYWFYSGQPKRTKFIGFSGAYHGDTTGAMSVGFSDFFHRPFSSLVFPTVFAPVVDALRAGNPPVTNPSAPVDEQLQKGRCWPSEDVELNKGLRDRCLAELEQLLIEHGPTIAAIVIEPIMQGAAGMICQPPGFLRGVADLARKHGTLLIADEVATGFGRTGRMFACEHEAVRPDILCIAKGITGGYLPLAATLCTDAIEKAFQGEPHERRTFFHGHTYTGNPLACAAAIASLDLFESTRLLERIQTNAAILSSRLDALRERAQFPGVVDVRQRGIMVGIEMDFALFGPPTGVGGPYDGLTSGHALCYSMRAKGLLIRPLGDTLVLMPIPSMSEGTLHRMLDVVIEALRG
jgi:adenosylmethionine-8-amino-7-oxononanoate aminotransferase